VIRTLRATKMRVRRDPPQIVESALSRALPPASRFVLRGGPQALAAGIASLGLPFSSVACRAEVAGGRAALWLGPDERLLLGPEHDADAMRGSLERSLTGSPHSLVEVSHRQVTLEVSGALAQAALNVGCPLDLHPSAFPVGMCTRTVFNKAEIVLWRTAPERFQLEVSRSFAAYVSSLLAEAASELSPQA
jgi:sarcosine oxidase, subunit gamma